MSAVAYWPSIYGFIFSYAYGYSIYRKWQVLSYKELIRTSTRFHFGFNTYPDVGSHGAPWGTHRRRAFTGRGRYKPRIKWHCGPRLAQTQHPNERFLHLHPFEFRFRHARRSFRSPSHRWRASRGELRRDLHRPQPTHRRPRFDLCGGVLGRLP